jgi:hypothetical protein
MEGPNKPRNPVFPVKIQFIFYWNGREPFDFCINMSMNKYVYQIQGALEDKRGKLLGLRVLVCNVDNLDSVDVPVEVLDSETAKYIQFRLSITAETVSINSMPYEIQNKIRAPLGRWLDHWVHDNFYGDNRKHKDTNP